MLAHPITAALLWEIIRHSSVKELRKAADCGLCRHVKMLVPYSNNTLGKTPQNYAGAVTVEKHIPI